MLHDVVQRKKFYTLVLQKCLTRSNIDNLIEKNKELVEVIQHKIIELDKLKQSLISSVVTGKIDIRDIVIPEYEKVESIFEEDEDQVEGGEDEWD